jgi:hypothetical protein
MTGVFSYLGLLCLHRAGSRDPDARAEPAMGIHGVVQCRHRRLLCNRCVYARDPDRGFRSRNTSATWACPGSSASRPRWPPLRWQHG